MKKLLLAALAAMMCGSVSAQSIYSKYSECPEGAVDLGIVMVQEDGTTYRVFWGTCNIGAGSPEEVGDFFAWGEVEPKDNYNWDNYKLADKYIIPDRGSYIGPAMRLDLEDDVAHVKLSGNWRMPTMGEWLALMKQCDWEYETAGKHGGYRVRSRENPENSIFLPIGGMRFVDELFDYGDEPSAHYWSSNVLLGNTLSAWSFSFNKLIISPYQNASYRHYGFSVRPVSE